MEAYKKLLLTNKAWAQERLKIRPDFFSRNVEAQNPGVHVDRVFRLACAC